jgi:hypothetical protein
LAGNSLRDTEEELEAGRRLNRALMRERNSNATELRQSPKLAPRRSQFRVPVLLAELQG